MAQIIKIATKRDMLPNPLRERLTVLNTAKTCPEVKNTEKLYNLKKTERIHCPDIHRKLQSAIAGI